MTLRARFRRIAERQVQGGHGDSETDDGAVEVLTELPGILAVAGVVVALFSWRRRKHRR